MSVSMKYKPKFSCVAIAVLAFSLASCSSLDFAASTPTNNVDKEVTTGQIEVQHVVSPGGIEAWLVEEHSIPIIAMNFAFQGGAYLDPDGKEGTASWLAGTLDEGAGPYDSQAFRALLEENSISLSFGADRDALRGSLKTLSANKDLAFDLVHLSLTEPRFDKEPTERVRGQILAGIRNAEMDPDAIGSRALYQELFPGHSYAREVSGTKDTLSKLGVKDLKGFLKAGVSKDRLKVGVVGDIDAATLANVLDQVFGQLPESADPRELSDVVASNKGGIKIIDQNNPQSSVNFAGPGILIDDPDYISAMVLNYTLGGGGFSSRLMDEVREKRGLTYGIYTYFAPLERTGLFLGQVATDNAKISETLAIVKQEIDKVRAEGVTEAELKDAKLYLTGAFPLGFASNASIASRLLAYQLYGFDIDYINRRNERVNAVTMEDIRRVAKRIPASDEITFVVVGKPEGLEGSK